VQAYGCSDAERAVQQREAERPLSRESTRPDDERRQLSFDLCFGSPSNRCRTLASLSGPD
jgi:hypothetical protein